MAKLIASVDNIARKFDNVNKVIGERVAAQVDEALQTRDEQMLNLLDQFENLKRRQAQLETNMDEIVQSSIATAMEKNKIDSASLRQEMDELKDFRDTAENRFEHLERSDRSTVVLLDGIKIDENKSLKQNIADELNHALGMRLTVRHFPLAHYFGPGRRPEDLSVIRA